MDDTPHGTIVLPASRYRAGGPSEIVTVARRWLSGNSRIYIAPHVPPLKEAGARGAHGAYLPESEPVLVLYDATLLGTCENGFAATAERLCWKNLLDHPRQIPWSEIDPATVVGYQGGVDLAGGSLNVSGELSSSVAGFLAELAHRSRPERGGPYRRGARPPPEEEAAEGAPDGIARLVTIARRGLGEVPNLYYHPAIPPRKLRRARAMHAAHLPPGEAVAALYDDTLFGDAEEGFLITARRFCWKNLSGDPASVPWEGLPPESVCANANLVHVGKGTVVFTAHRELPMRLAALLAALSREGSR